MTSIHGARMWRLFIRGSLLMVTLILAGTFFRPAQATATSRQIVPINLSQLQPATGSLFFSYYYGNTFDIAVSWSKGESFAGVESFPFQAYNALITFLPKSGYTLDGVDLTQFRFRQGTQLSRENVQSNQLKVTFQPTTGNKVYRVYTDFRRNRTKNMNTSLLVRANGMDMWAENTFVNSQIQKRLSLFMDGYDPLISPIIEKYFYPLPDVDGNAKVDVLVSNLPAGTNGYVNYADQSVENYFNGTNFPNFGETIYLDDSLVLNENADAKTTFNRVLIHELQHVANRNFSEVWLNEALSEAASHLYFLRIGLDGLQENIDAFNRAPDRYTRDVTEWYGDGLSYAKSYLFGQYLRTQVERIHGRGNVNVYRELIEADQRKSSRQAVEFIIQKYISPSYSFSEFVYDFNTALQRKDVAGKYGFNGETFIRTLR